MPIAKPTVPAPPPDEQPSPRKLPKHMHRRGRMLYFKRKIPGDVAHGFPEHRGQVWVSLGTEHIEPAKVMLAVEATEFELRVAELRRQNALRRASSLAERAGVRSSIVGVQDGETQVAQHACDPRAILLPVSVHQPAPTGVAGQGGNEPDSGHTETPPAAVAMPAARRQAKRPTTASMPVRMRDGPPAYRPMVSSNPVVRPTMLHLFEDWKRKQTRVRTINAVRTVVLEFRAMHGPMPVEELTRAHARAYRDHLIERELSKLTVENRLGFLATLVRHGMCELVDGLAINPFDGIDVSGAKGARPPKDRRAFSMAELNKLYSSALYTTDYRPRGQAADAAYWLPLMGPFVGARIEELCQLRVEDVQRINGVWCVRICDLDASQHVKTSSSFRRVPLHDIVIRCGFLRYVAQTARAGHDRVFPSLSNENAHRIYSNSVGKWFGRYLDTLGLTDRRLDYHSFRYLMRQQCSLCGIDNEVRDALTGHWLSNSDAGRTYLKGENRQYPFPKLVEAMRQLRYDELKVSHLFVEQPMAGVEGVLLP